MREFKKESIPRPKGDFSFVQELKWPITLEIGCGVGRHPIDWARQNPDKEIVAIERTNEKFRKFIKNFHEAGEPKNLHPVQADAVAWASHFLPESSVETLYILYPNPYPKNRQANQRFYNMPFMSELKKILVPGGRVIYATNLQDHIIEARESFVEQWGFRVESEKELIDPREARTHFEEKYLRRGEVCYNLVVTSC